jgi:RNA polymerase sigma factor (TIGR02999 family)
MFVSSLLASARLAETQKKNYKRDYNFWGMAPRTAEVTRLLRAWGAGDQGALEHLMPLVYGELHRLAGRYMQREHPGNTLQATALVNEAYLRLVDVTGVRWEDRAHFFALSSQMMRRILVDAARARGADKRGGGAVRLNLNESIDGMVQRDSRLVELDAALDSLAQFDARRARVVEMRFFGGMSVEETAEALKISTPSVMRDWKLARAWLTRELSR